MTQRDPRARTMASAPRDGRILRLLVDYLADDARNPLDDASEAWTIGSNAFDNDGVDEWQFAGWDWSHDCFTEGEGTVIGWLPFHGESVPETDDPAPAEAGLTYFLVGDDEGPEPLTLAQLHEAIGFIWDAAGDEGWIDGIADLRVYEGHLISRAVETSRRSAEECPVCCGGNVAEEIAEASGGDECPNCDGIGLVSSEAFEEVWTSQFDVIIGYEMQPPLPPIASGGP